MEETTHAAPPVDTPQQDAPQEGVPTAYGYCSWHHRFADDVRLINLIEQGSGVGMGGAHYACRPCREQHHLVPYADR